MVKSPGVADGSVGFQFFTFQRKELIGGRRELDRGTFLKQ